MADRDTNNFLHLEEAPGAVDNYKLFRLSGEERISAPFLFRLTIRSHGDIPPASAWINASITFSLGNSDMDEKRRINGRCASFEHIYQKGAYVEFAIEVAPAFEALQLTRDRRIFTDKSAKDVIAAILSEHRIAFDNSKYGRSATRDYVVQQDESDFAFINRLMEDEGVFYYFQFDEGAAPYKHRMVLAGDTSGYYDGNPFDLSFRRDHLLRGLNDLQMGYASAPAKVVTHDYDFKKPGDLTPVTAPSKLDWAAPSGQIYRYAEDYADAGSGQERAKLRIEGAERGAVTMKGSGSYVAFAPAARFQVQDPRLDPRERRIVLRSITHDAFDPYGGDEGEPHYDQQFEAQPSTQVFRPERSTPRAISRGPQTADVIDNNDPDGFGRIKVKFHWDRTGTSTCWVRVLQPWAGNKMGAQFMPRPGMEVLVDFIEGRADRPVVVGCLHNGRNTHSYAVPANLTQTGFRSYGDGNLVHELILEDKGGSEAIMLNSGRDFARNVARNESAHVQGLSEITIGTTSRTMSADRMLIESGKAITIKVGASKITIDQDGVWIDAPMINLNSPGAPDHDVSAVTEPAKAAAAAAAAKQQQAAAQRAAAAAPPGSSERGGRAGTGGGGPMAEGPGGGQLSGGPQSADVNGAGLLPAPERGSMEKDELARRVVQPGGSGTQEDVDAVVGQMQRLPQSAIERLEENGTKVIAARDSITDYRTDLKGMQPRGWAPGSTYDQVKGIYDPASNEVIVATSAGENGMRRAWGSASPNVVVHEVAHAIDYKTARDLTSGSDAFQAARNADLSALSNYEQQARIGIEETFAESAARYYSGYQGPIATPNLDRYWQINPLGGRK